MDPLEELQNHLAQAIEQLDDLAFEVRYECETILTDISDKLAASARAIREHQQRVDDLTSARILDAESRADRIATKVTAVSLDEGLNVVDGCHVYLLWGPDRPAPLYVGRSTNVLARLGKHLSDPAKRRQVHSVSALRCADVATMVDTEAALIRRYQPPLNVLGVVTA